jgi:hypothetical protein
VFPTSKGISAQSRKTNAVSLEIMAQRFPKLTNDVKCTFEKLCKSQGGYGGKMTPT